MKNKKPDNKLWGVVDAGGKVREANPRRKTSAGVCRLLNYEVCQSYPGFTRPFRVRRVKVMVIP